MRMRSIRFKPGVWECMLNEFQRRQCIDWLKQALSPQALIYSCPDGTILMKEPNQ